MHGEFNVGGNFLWLCFQNLSLHRLIVVNMIHFFEMMLIDLNFVHRCCTISGKPTAIVILVVKLN